MSLSVLFFVFFTNLVDSCSSNTSAQNDDAARQALSGWALQIPDVIDDLDGSPGFSSAYSVQLVPNRTGEEEKNELLQKFVKSQSDFGLKPTRLIIESSGFPTNYWSVDFVGCDPGECAEVLYEHIFVKTDRKDWLKHKRSNGRSQVVHLRDLVFGETTYTVFLNFLFDEEGNILATEIYSQREAESSLEAAGASITSGGNTNLVTVFSGRRILAGNN